MSLQRHVILLLLCASAFALLTLLFVNARGAQRGAYVHAKDTLRQIRELDARLDSETLQARYALNGNFDPLVETTHALAVRFRVLTQLATARQPLHSVLVETRVKEAAAAFATKRELVEDIKTQTAVLRNSARFMPRALLECDVQGFASEMRRLLLANLLSPTPEVRAEVAALIQRTEADIQATTPALKRAAAHAGVLAARSELLDKLVGAYLAVPSLRAVNVASGAYDVARQQVDDRAAIYRLGLYAACGALVFYVAAVLLHLARLNRAVRRFVPYEFLRLLQKSSVADIGVGDCMQQEMTVLFADIRSFTTISEKLTPRGVFQFINTYMARMEPCIQGHGGVVSQYYGDGIMAIFPGTPDGAVDAAVAMLAALKSFNAARIAAGDAPVQIGIGLNTGPLILGTIGGPERLECNVISDVVNFSSRIEGMNKMYGTSLLIGDRTYQGLADRARHRFRVADHVRVKGMERPCTVYEVLDGQDERALPEYEEGLRRYEARDFAGAAASFRICVEKLPKELLFQVWLERCERFAAAPPPSDWDGIVRLEGK